MFSIKSHLPKSYKNTGWHIEKLDDEIASVKTKNFEVYGSKKSRTKKRWEEVIKKDMLTRGLHS